MRTMRTRTGQIRANAIHKFGKVGKSHRVVVFMRPLVEKRIRALSRRVPGKNPDKRLGCFFVCARFSFGFLCLCFRIRVKLYDERKRERELKMMCECK